MKIKQQGLTLIELLVTVAIVVILSTIASPSWTKLIQDNSITTAINQVQSIYQLARSEALKRNNDVTLTSTDNRQTWTLTTTIGTVTTDLKTMTLTTDNVVIADADLTNTSEISIDINKTGFAENQKITFTWDTEYRCLVIFPSGQTTTSSETGDCA